MDHETQVIVKKAISRELRNLVWILGRGLDQVFIILVEPRLVGFKAKTTHPHQ